MSRDIVPLGLRMQPSLKQSIEKAARAAGRSMNAEICTRLSDSFTADYVNLPFEIAQAVEAEMEQTGLSQRDALVRLVLAGQSAGGTVLHLNVQPGTTAKEVRDALTEAIKHIPPDANVVSARS